MFDNRVIDLLIGDFPNSLSLLINTYNFYKIAFNFKMAFANGLTLASSTSLGIPTEGSVPIMTFCSSREQGPSRADSPGTTLPTAQPWLLIRQGPVIWRPTRPSGLVVA